MGKNDGGGGEEGAANTWMATIRKKKEVRKMRVFFTGNILAVLLPKFL